MERSAARADVASDPAGSKGGNEMPVAAWLSSDWIQGLDHILHRQTIVAGKWESAQQQQKTPVGNRYCLYPQPEHPPTSAGSPFPWRLHCVFCCEEQNESKQNAGTSQVHRVVALD